MNSKKRFYALLLCVVLLVSMLGGCSKVKKSTEESSTDANATTAPTVAAADTATAAPAQLDPMEISVAVWGIQDAFDKTNAADDTIFNDLCKKFNITIKPVGITWNDWQEKNKVWAASGSLPDVFVDAQAGSDLLTTWAQQGVIKAMPDDLSTYPNLQKLFGLNSVKPLAIDGKFYMIPRGGDLTLSTNEASGMSRLVMYRKDWAAAAGYTEAPTTYDGLVEMTKAMMAQHSDAVGIATNNAGYLPTFALDIFPELPTGAWVYENNQWIPSYASEKTVAFMDRLQNLYRNGILDPDFITQKDGDALGKFVSGKACIFLGSNIESQAQTFMDSNKDVAKIEDAIGFIAPFKAADGNAYQFTGTPYWSESYISAQVDDAKLQRILMMMDYMYSHEYASLMNNGIEGVDWKKTDSGNVSLLDSSTTLADKYPITSSFGYLSSWATGFAQSPDMVVSSSAPIAAYRASLNELYAYETDNCPIAPVNFEVLLMNNKEKGAIASLNTDFETAFKNCAIGSDDAKTAWDAMIKDFNTKGLQEAITSVTKQAAEQGIAQ